MKISEKLITEIHGGTFCSHQLILDGPKIHHKNIVRLVDAIKLNNNIKKIFLGEIESIDEESVKLLASLTNLEEISAIDAYITDMGARELLKSKVKVLCLKANSLTDACLEEIGNNKTLIKLSLSCNKITDKGAEMISRNSTIKELHLMQCFLEDGCAAPLAAMKSLEKLDLRTNMITNVGFNILYNSNIREIDLGQNWNENHIEKITPERLKLREHAKLPSPTPAFEISKKREKPERKDQAEKEETEQVEASSKRLKTFTGT